MITAAQAIAKAKSISSWAVGRCDEFVASVYGFGSSGYSTAVANWQATPSSLKHPGDWNAPAGALMYWSGGSTGAGHVALSLGNGSIISTDATGPGTVGQISARTPTDKWGHPYLGWAFPFFQGKEATATLGPWSGATTISNTGTTVPVSADSVTAGFFSGISGVFSTFLMSFVWGGEIAISIVLIITGIFILVRGFRES
jgi:hypothetical protein